MRAYFCDQGVGFEVERWADVSRLYRRLIGLALRERFSAKRKDRSRRLRGDGAPAVGELCSMRVRV